MRVVLSKLTFCFIASLLFPTASISEAAPQLENVVFNSQNWHEQDLFDWYSSGQGSRLVPLEWFDKMIDPETGLAFGSKENMARFGYPSFNINGARPIGFLIDTDSENKPWIGMSCPACHTSILTKNEQTYLFHGGQSMGNFRKMLTNLVKTVKSYADDPKARAVLPHQEEIEAWLHEREYIDTALENTGDWGPGRLDAVAYIGAKVNYMLHDFEDDAPFFKTTANAPVNPPPAWNATQLQIVQYAGFADIEYEEGKRPLVYRGAYFRNYIQALAVFSQTRYEKAEGLQSSIDARNLILLEDTLKSLDSPTWPEAFGKINADLAKKGEEIFTEECASCHGQISASDQDSMILETAHNDYKVGNPFLRMVSVFPSEDPEEPYSSTDLMSVCNVRTLYLPTGKLKGNQRNFTYQGKLNRDRYGETASMLDLAAFVSNADYGNRKLSIASGLLSRALKDFEKGVDYILFDDGTRYEPDWTFYSPETPVRASYAVGGYRSYEEEKEDCEAKFAKGNKSFAYKARPLNGIWATAPFLHNGSVPSLMDLLKPQDCEAFDDCRPQTFSFKGLEFDTTNVGYELQDRNDDAHDFQVKDEDGVLIPGNWNGGHEYGTCADTESCLDDQERLALVEYLKTL